MSLRSLRPTTSTGWFLSRSRMALKFLPPDLASAIHSLAKVPSWTSLRIRFISALGFGGDDPRAAGVVAVFGRVADAVAHVVEAALVEEVDDELELVHAFEVGHLGLVAGFDEGFEACFDEGRGAAAENGLFAEEVGFGFFGDRGVDDAAAGAADALGVGHADVERGGRSAFAGGDEAGDAAAGDELAADEVAGAFGGDE